jgi:hypothetical protein
MVTTHLHKVLVLMIAAFALAVQVHLATPQGKVTVEPVPVLSTTSNVRCDCKRVLKGIHP